MYLLQSYFDGLLCMVSAEATHLVPRYFFAAIPASWVSEATFACMCRQNPVVSGVDRKHFSFRRKAIELPKADI